MSNAGWKTHEALNAAGWYQIWTGPTKFSLILFSNGDDPRDQSAIITGFQLTK